MKIIRIVLWIVFVLMAICGVILLLTGATDAYVGYLVCLVIVLVPLILLQRKATKDTPKKQSAPRPGSQFDAFIVTSYKDGLGTLTPGCYCMIALSGDRIEFRASPKDSDPPAATMNISQITNIGAFTEAELIEKSRSVVGRGMAGGLVFGPVGAIVGGLSGTKSKKTRRYHQYIVLNFIPTGANLPVAATFEEDNPLNKTAAFISAVKSKLPETIQL